MIKATVGAGLAAALLMGAAGLAHAQTYGQSYGDQSYNNDSGYQYPTQSYDQTRERYRQQQRQHQQALDQYNRDRQRYQQQRQNYQNQQYAYRERRNAYEGARARYEADRVAYDDEYGAGAWQRYYYDHRDAFDARYGPGAWEVEFGNGYSAYPAAPNAYYYGEPSTYSGRTYDCENQRNTAGLVGGVIGAIAGGAIGSSVAHGSDRGVGTVAGAVLGGAVGAGIGRATAECDQRGYYFSYNDTYPYREGYWERGSSGAHDYGWYSSHGCRLAPAPTTSDGYTEDRWVRVCPDDEGRYRITS